MIVRKLCPECKKVTLHFVKIRSIQSYNEEISYLNVCWTHGCGITEEERVKVNKYSIEKCSKKQWNEWHINQYGRPFFT